MLECYIKRYVKVAVPPVTLSKGVNAVMTAIKSKQYAETTVLEYFDVSNESNITIARSKVGA